jgi:hypothetical protein
LYGVIYGTYLGINKTFDNNPSSMIWLILFSIVISIIFGVLIIAISLTQLNAKRGSTNAQFFILGLACLTVNLPGIIFISIGMIKQNFYQDRNEPLDNEPRK